MSEQEYNAPFEDLLAKSILEDYENYENLKPWVKEGIVHRLGQPNQPRKNASRNLEVKFRMRDELYQKSMKWVSTMSMKMESLTRYYLTYNHYVKSIQEYIPTTNSNS